MRPANLTLHVEGTSWLHACHPFNKLAYVLLVGVVVYCAPGAWVPDVALIVLNAFFAAYCGLLAAMWGLVWRTLLPLALFMLPIHGTLYPDNQTPLYFFSFFTLYAEGLYFAGVILLQLTAVLTASLLFVFATHPSDYIAALTQAGWPSSLAYLMGSPLLMLPAMRARAATIQAAQRARGLDAEGGILGRVRSLAPLVAPLVLGAFAEVEQRAIALELRGFSASGPRTSLRDIADSSLQRLLRWGMLAFSLGLALYACFF